MCWNWNVDVLRNVGQDTCTDCWEFGAEVSSEMKYHWLIYGWFHGVFGKMGKIQGRRAFPQCESVDRLIGALNWGETVWERWKSFFTLTMYLSVKHNFENFFSHDVILISWFDFLFNMDNQIQILTLFVMLRFVMDTSRSKPLLFFQFCRLRYFPCAIVALFWDLIYIRSYSLQKKILTSLHLISTLLEFFSIFSFLPPKQSWFLTRVFWKCGETGLHGQVVTVIMLEDLLSLYYGDSFLIHWYLSVHNLSMNILNHYHSI